MVTYALLQAFLTSQPKSITHVLFDLCLHPEYVDALRAEVESPGFYDFMQTTKGLPLLDSFIKESSRLNPIEASTSPSSLVVRLFSPTGSVWTKGSSERFRFLGWNAGEER
jgi:hypothetical protein